MSTRAFARLPPRRPDQDPDRPQSLSGGRSRFGGGALLVFGIPKIKAGRLGRSDNLPSDAMYESNPSSSAARKGWSLDALFGRAAGATEPQPSGAPAAPAAAPRATDLFTRIGDF